VVAIQDAPFIVFAGTVLSPGGADRVDITSPSLTGIHQSCRVRNRAWMSFPEPFTEGMVITAVWREGDRVLFERQSEPLGSDALEPIFRAGWTSYAPLGWGACPEAHARPGSSLDCRPFGGCSMMSWRQAGEFRRGQALRATTARTP
jgi:hypothetical protein